LTEFNVPLLTPGRRESVADLASGK
jgi:hypothetical protein